MNLTALNSKTGKIIMSQAGGMTEAAFRKTVASTFPDLQAEYLIIVRDGEIIGSPSSAPAVLSKKSVVWRGSFKDLGGYANMNREITMRLLQRGFSVKLDVLNTAPQVDPITMGMINALGAVRLANETSAPLVVGFTPMPVQSRGRKTVFFTMMETQGLHPEFADRCNKYASEIWVPCKFYLDSFKKNGIYKPLHLIPLGVNQHIYHPLAKEPVLKYEEMPSGQILESIPKSFRFMSLFGWSYRKGPDVLCRSFLKEFDSSDDACLVIYSRYAGGSGEEQKEHVRSEIRGYYKEIGKTNPPPIYYCGDPITISDLPGCYAAADCFVFCSRGEGFGLPVCEAAACEIPVISTYNTAMTQYLDEDNAFLVQSDEYAPADDKLTWITEFYRNQLFPVLGEASINEFGRHMREVYRNPKDADQKVRNFKASILKDYTWDVCADRVAHRLSMM